MSIPILRSAKRTELKARAHALSPVVMIGDSGLSENVLAEIERALAAHELIKIRVQGDDRAARLSLLETICAASGAAPVQQIGKLLIVYRPKPNDQRISEFAGRATKLAAAKKAKAAAKPGRRNPISGRLVAERAPRKGVKAAADNHPPRTARVRKAGQKSAKKPFQDQ